jgi:hypothetical protein
VLGRAEKRRPSMRPSRMCGPAPEAAMVLA